MFKDHNELNIPFWEKPDRAGWLMKQGNERDIINMKEIGEIINDNVYIYTKT